jgi:hypothetical protein
MKRDKVCIIGPFVPAIVDEVLVARDFDVRRIADLSEALPDDPYSIDQRIRTFILAAGVTTLRERLWFGIYV